MLTFLIAYGWLFLGLFHAGITLQQSGGGREGYFIAHVAVGLFLWPLSLPIHLGKMLAHFVGR